MTTITNDLGTFEAETEEQAIALARKAKREAKKKQEQAALDYELAMLRAKSNGYTILARLAKGEEFPRGWHLHAPHDKYTPWNLEFRESYSYGNVPVITWHGEHGTAVSDHYGNTFLGGVSNGAGFPMCLFLREIRETSSDSPVCCYAVGIQGDQIALAELPGIEMSAFQREEREAS